MNDNLISPEELFQHLFGYTQAGPLYYSQETAFFPGFDFEQAKASKPDFNTSAEIQQYAEKVRKSAFVKKNWALASKLSTPSYRLVYDDSLHGGAMSEPHSRVLSFTYNGFSAKKYAVLHELAHLIDSDTSSNQEVTMADSTGHGPRFAGILLRLINEFLGKAEADKLEEAYKVNGVVYVP